MKNIKKLLFLALMLFTLISCMVEEEDLEPVSKNDTAEFLVEIPTGSTANEIAKILKEKNLIKKTIAFTQVVRKEKLASSLKAGNYMLSRSMSSLDIAKKIAKGEIYIESTNVTIPEGFEFREIITKFAKEANLSEEKFLELIDENYDFDFIQKRENVENKLEGYLFPATYSVTKDMDEKDVINMMLAKFKEVYDDVISKQISNSDLNLSEIVTLASIVEREGADLSEFKTISGVFHNRLRDSMLFQSCASVQFLLKERKDNLLYSDLEIESPYNTYKYEGLPPGPIASPGLEAIKAALKPEEHDYYYFVVSGKNDGKHIFSKTLEEHEKAKSKALGN